MIYQTYEIPRWLRGGIRPTNRGASIRKFLYGGDTETIHGRPMSFQFFSDQAHRDDMIWIKNIDHATDYLIAWCQSLASHAQHIVYIHNLEFDLVSLFWNIKEQLVIGESGAFDFTISGWRVSGVYGAPTFAKLVDSAAHRSVLLVDSYSYYRASLAKAATVFCPNLPKLSRPEGLGERLFTAANPGFVAYAMRDAVVAYHIGVALEELHQEFDLPQTVSVADMAARIFRHRYLEHPIPHPPRQIMDCSLSSYHGGKNNLHAAPGWYENVKSLDISSAYPHAMAGFPSFSDVRQYKKFAAKCPSRVPALGVYRVRGRVDDCSWPSLFAHDFRPLRNTSVNELCVSGYDLNEALRCDEFKPQSVVGWFYDADGDSNTPPLKSFVDDFYARKEAEKDKGRRAMYKFILNSISGKFIQTRPQDRVLRVDIDDGGRVNNSGDLVGGGLFHPFIASLITGHTRAAVHRLEHDYDALHTATDGIFTQSTLVRPPESGLGAVVHEASGDLLLLRNKLYILYGEGRGAAGAEQSSVYEDRHIIKAARHGFAGTTADLELLASTGERDYKATRANRLRSSVKRRLIPNDFVQRSYTLHVGPLPVYTLPSRMPIDTPSIV